MYLKNKWFDDKNEEENNSIRMSKLYHYADITSSTIIYLYFLIVTYTSSPWLTASEGGLR